jgi:hypothetical protein
MQPMEPSMIGANVPTALHGVAVVGEVGPVAAVDPATVDEQRLGAVVQRPPFDRLLVQV